MFEFYVRYKIFNFSKVTYIEELNFEGNFFISSIDDDIQELLISEIKKSIKFNKKLPFYIRFFPFFISVELVEYICLGRKN